VNSTCALVLPGAGVTLATNVNVNIYDVLYHDKIVFTKEAISVLQDKLSK